ncbi:MAG TPA: MFS transporter [Phycisphaerae bacterium]|nr:MFS transporter [Phycisphaerae bacterium]HRY70344.1 MFS transporter [Phycisphaerae bacterium]HSA28061.1 MFS transporter [Phycisphaerae bacterium]
MHEGDATSGHDPYTALRGRDFRLFLSGNLLANLGMQMQNAAVGWEIYDRTGQPWALGAVGLAEFLPVVAFTLIAGQAADRFNRRLVAIVGLTVMGAGSLGLAAVSLYRGPILLVYALLILVGAARAFTTPAKAALMPQIVPRERFSNAVTWNSGGFQVASIAGPALGGWLIYLLGKATTVYVLVTVADLVFVVLLSLLRYRPALPPNEPVTLRSLFAGVGFLWNSPLVLGAMTLDMFAVLLGGATTLLPIYARDILHVGPDGFGWLRASPALGALAMAFLLAHRPPMRQAGRAMLWAVAGFGMATIAFGLSRWFWLSMTMLALTGALDTISVVVRHTLIQLLTPDPMRGRVSAVNSMFIGASNELGGAESGFVAALFTPTISVVGGGIGTILVVITVAVTWPQLRRYGRLGSDAPAPAFPIAEPLRAPARPQPGQ